MQIKREQLGPTKVKLTVAADQAAMDAVKQAVLGRLAPEIKVPGFRPGKAPAQLVEKHLDQAALQNEFLDQAVQQFYAHAAEQQELRPVAPPNVTLTKFVPYSTLEFTAEVEVVGDITLADYKNLKQALPKSEITAPEVAAVLDDLRRRGAGKKAVDRAAKTGDEVTIDFIGSDAKTKQPIAGADGQDYPLILGSKNFIPGFEEELVGLKPDADKTFEITFPKDYGSTELQNRRVSFQVTVKQIQELSLPKLDNAFATTIGPFKNLTELKADIKQQLLAEKQQQAQQAYDNELLQTIASKSEVAIPDALINEEIDRTEEEEKRSVVYHGQTWQEHLDAEKLTADEHRAKQRPAAELRVKAGLILGEIADREQITVTPAELDNHIKQLRQRYATDPAMQTQLDNPDNRRDLLGRLLTAKTLTALRSYATK